MDKLVLFFLVIPAFVHGQQTCSDVGALVECINTLTDGIARNPRNTTAACLLYGYFKGCVTRLPGCLETNAIPNTVKELAQSGTNLAACEDATSKRPWTTDEVWWRTTTRRGMGTTTRAPSGCDVRFIDRCTNSLMMVINAARGDKDRICPAGVQAVGCLNALMSCVSVREFTQARILIEDELNLPDLCRDLLGQFPFISSATTCRSVPLMAVLTLILGYILA